MPIQKFACKHCGSIFTNEQECIAHENDCAPLVVSVNLFPDTIDEVSIVCILDRSGSMNSIQDDAIGGFNNFIEEQKKVPGSASLTLVMFNHEYQLVYADKPLDEAVILNKTTYVPCGTTALLDAIGRTITDIDSRKVSSKVIVSILTDGQENSSKDYSKSQITDLIQTKRNQGWEFIFLAANQDAFTEASQLGIDPKRAYNFTADANGMKHAYRSMGERVASYRMP